MDYKFLGYCQYEVPGQPHPVDCGEPAVARVWWEPEGEMLVCKGHLDFIICTEDVLHLLPEPTPQEAEPKAEEPLALVNGRWARLPLPKSLVVEVGQALQSLLHESTLRDIVILANKFPNASLLEVVENVDPMAMSALDRYKRETGDG